MDNHIIQCAFCTKHGATGQWWQLTEYYGLNGIACPKCFDKVAHNSHGKPNNPEGYAEVRARALLLGRN